MNAISARIILALLALAALWLQYSYWFGEHDGVANIGGVKRDIAQWQEVNDSLRISNELLRARLHDLKTNPAHTEELAREQLFMIKEDEIYVLPVENRQ